MGETEREGDTFWSDKFCLWSISSLGGEMVLPVDFSLRLQCFFFIRPKCVSFAFCLCSTMSFLFDWYKGKMITIFFLVIHDKWKAFFFPFVFPFEFNINN